MIQESKKLLNLPVFTESGRELGRLVDFRIDTESQSIIDYFVQPHRAIANLFGGKLIIKRGQIVDILMDKIIVIDNLEPGLREKLNNLKKDKVALPVTEKMN
jgi:sporulation protein YlmC with PRC-barrel domain